MNVTAVNFTIDPCWNELPKEREKDRRECDKFLMEEQWLEANTEYHVIRAMHSGASTLTEIAKASGKGRMTAHRTLKRLVDGGVVRRERGAHQGEPDRFRWIG